MDSKGVLEIVHARSSLSSLAVALKHKIYEILRKSEVCKGLEHISSKGEDPNVAD